MNNSQDYLSNVAVIRPSAPATIESATTTNFDFAIDQDVLGGRCILDVIARTNGTAAITSLTLASDASFSEDIALFNDSNPNGISKNDRLSETAPFAQTSLSAAGKKAIYFGNINKKVHKFARIIVTTTGTVDLDLQVLVELVKTKAPVVIS